MNATQAGVMIGAAIVLARVERRQKLPISVSEWLRLERRRIDLASAVKTGQMPKEENR